jgi:hypothetical protein
VKYEGKRNIKAIIIFKECILLCYPIHCDVRLENWNLLICWAELGEARSHGNTKYTVTVDFDGAFGDISMVTTF